MTDLERAVKENDLILTAWDDERLVGAARVLTDFGYRAVLADLIVRPERRGQGIGRLLVRAGLSHPHLAAVATFTLFTATARPFYEQLGFCPYPGQGMVYRREPSGQAAHGHAGG